MKFFLSLLIGVVQVCAWAGGNPEASRYVSPGHALRLFERADGNPGHYAKWKGRLELTGVLVVEFYRVTPSEPPPKPGTGVVFFEPDPPSLERLPVAVGKVHPGRPESIWVEDAEPVPILTALLGAERAALVRDGILPRYELPVRLQLSEIGTSIDCDRRNFSLKYTKISLRTGTLVAMGQAEHFGC